MNPESVAYLFYLVISLFVSFKYGRNRNIGITWSVIFSLFCPVISIIVILLSKKKNIESITPSTVNLGVITLIIFILGFIFNPTKEFYETLGALTLPISVFILKISAEQQGQMSFRNIMTLLPIYGLLRNYTIDYFP